MNLKKSLAGLMTFIMLFGMIPSVVPYENNPITAEAAAVKISSKKLTLIKGQSKTLKIRGTAKKVKWSSSKKQVAAVNKKGKVTAKGRGTATITAKVGNKKYRCSVKVETPAISKRSVTLKKGQKYSLKITGTRQKVSWSSSRKSVASVSSRGRISARRYGKTTITARVGGRKYSCRVTVNARGGNNAAVTGVKLNQTGIALERGTIVKLTATVLPADAKSKAVTWSSANTAVAQVDKNGTVRAVGVGKTYITAKAGNKTTHCTVDVYKKTSEAEAPKISVKQPYSEKYSGLGLRLLEITNNGSKTLRVYDVEAYTLADGTEKTSSKLLLLDAEAAKQEKIKYLKLLDIRPGQTRQVLYGTRTSGTRYDGKTIIRYNFKYDTITYTAESSINRGTRLYKSKTHITD